MDDFKKQLDDFLLLTAQKGGSDLHLSPGYYPTVRIDGHLIPLSDVLILDSTLLENFAKAALGPRMERFLKELEADFSYELSQGLRFRANVYKTRGSYALTFRYIIPDIKTLEQLGLPASIHIFSKLSQGFVLVVGPNGHGKSTTMAAIINQINTERAEKIITIEDPIEYIFTPVRSIIDQRELGADTYSFANSLRAALRENVNVVMVGEMRDYETISAAVSAAETGHLVFASLHTNNAAQTIERIVDSFPPNQQQEIVAQLADSISGVVSQRLVPGARGGLVPAVEVMIANTAIRNIIRENKPQQLNLAIETGSDIGMISLDRSLADLVRKQLITVDQAQFYSQNPSEFKSLL